MLVRAVLPAERPDGSIHLYETLHNTHVAVLQAERDVFKAKGEELEQELEASKAREGALSAELQETQGRLEVITAMAMVLAQTCVHLLFSVA